MCLLNRFCFKWSIATGVNVIGYMFLCEIIFVLTLYTASQLYSYLGVIILPAISFLCFAKMNKKDSIKARRRFFLIALIDFIIMDTIQIYQVSWARLRYEYQRNNHADCVKQICILGYSPAFEISCAYLALRLIWQIYAVIILRQHWLNKRDGRGDAKNHTANDMPEYLLAQQEWVEELNQEKSDRRQIGT